MSKKINKKSAEYKKNIEEIKKGLMVSSKKKTGILITVAATVVTFGALGGGHFIYKAAHPPVVDVNNCVVRFFSRGNEVSNITLKKGEKLESPDSPEVGDLTFDGWFLDKEFTRRCIFPMTITENIDIYLKWNVVISFDSKGGSPILPQTYRYDDIVTKPNDPTLARHDFIGWYEDEKCTKEFEFGMPAKKSTKLYAKWDQNLFTVRYFYGDGREEDPVIENVEKGGTAPKPSTPISKKELEFEGWYTEPNFQNKFDFETEITKDTDLYCKWNPKEKDTYIVTFSFGDGVTFEQQIVKDGEYAKEPEKRKYPGYEFKHWCTDEELKRPFDFKTPITHAMTLYARWDKLPTYVTEEEYKESFENLVNINDLDRDLNYFAEGSIKKYSDGKETPDFSVTGLRVTKDKNGDRETFYDEENKIQYFTIKSDNFYNYVRTDNQTSIGTFDSFRVENIRDQLAEFIKRIYEDYSLLEFQNDLGYFTYHYDETSPETYHIDTIIAFNEDKKLSNISSSYTHNNVNVEMHVKYSYGEQKVYIPTGWDVEVSNRTHILESQDDRYVTRTGLVNEYFKGEHIAKIEKPSSSLNLRTLRLFDGNGTYMSIPITDAVIFKNGTLLVNGTDYTSGTTTTGKSTIVLAETLKNTDRLEIKFTLNSDLRTPQAFLEMIA